MGDRAIPLQGVYSSSKHAVKGFTDALRMELEEEGAPVSVTLVKPSTIDTPYTKHAKNLMEREPALPPPLYAPETVAEAILHCAETPVRDVYVGGAGKALSLMEKYAPRLTDRYMEAFMFEQQQQDWPPGAPGDAGLYEASGELKERSGDPRFVMESSLYTRASLHPLVTGALFAGAGLVALALLRRPRRANGGVRAVRARKAEGAWPSAAGLPAEG